MTDPHLPTPAAAPPKCVCGHRADSHVPFPACGDLGWYGCLECDRADRDRCKSFCAAASPVSTDSDFLALLQSFEDAIRLVGSSLRDDINDRYDEEYNAAREALIAYHEERSLTAEEALWLTHVGDDPAVAHIRNPFEFNRALNAKLRRISGSPARRDDDEDILRLTGDLGDAQD